MKLLGALIGLIALTAITLTAGPSILASTHSTFCEDNKVTHDCVMMESSAGDILYLQGDFEGAREWYKKRAEAGDAERMFDVGLTYLEEVQVIRKSVMLPETRDDPWKQEFRLSMQDMDSFGGMANVTPSLPYDKQRLALQKSKESSRWFMKAMNNGYQLSRSEIINLETMYVILPPNMQRPGKTAWRAAYLEPTPAEALGLNRPVR